MKKITSILLALCMAIGLAMPTAQAASSSATSAQQIVQALGIITGDESGNLNLGNYVTRAEFAKMMIAASTYKDTISSNAKASPFKDVKYTHWAASYVQAAVTAGWLTGYTDGTYKPDNNVKLEEAVSAVLKMLGYSSSDFTGSFPEAQLAKYSALGLNDNISKTQGQLLTRQDCINLFYNLMRTKNKSGSYYATTLGYTVNSSGELDYSSLVLANMSGPYIVESSTWSSSLPFTASTAIVYKNGSASTISAVSTYDAYYYNTSMRTIWVYRNQVSGVYTAASPSTSAPTSVTVAGNSYSISTSAAAYALSNMGSFGIGDSVTLILGMNGDVVGVVSADDVYSTKYGIVVSTGTVSYTDSSGTVQTKDTITVACTNGNTYEYEYDNYAGGIGAMIEVNYSSGKVVFSVLGTKNLSGSVNSAGTVLGSYYFASDVQILDTTANGAYIRIYPSRLAGLELTTDSVKYYVLDANGKISDLILNNVTGDMCKYGIITDVPSISYSLNITGSYKYIINGVSGSDSSNTAIYAVKSGPAQIEFVNGSIVGMQALTQVNITSLNSGYALVIGSQYSLDNSVSAYIFEDSSYKLSNISTLSSLNGYTLYGYYDKSISTGGRIRVIVAFDK